MQIVNLTPHPVTITTGEHAGTYPPAGLARVAYLPDGPIEGLPLPQADTLYIVSVIVAEAAPLRYDLRVPGRQARDEQQRIIGAESLERPEQASPALARARREAAEYTAYRARREAERHELARALHMWVEFSDVAPVGALEDYVPRIVDRLKQDAAHILQLQAERAELERQLRQHAARLQREADEDRFDAASL